TTMVGFPWETAEHLQRTYDVARDLLLYRAKRGDCLEANVVIPYPGTPLHKYMKDNKWFTIDPMNYDAYGLSKPIVQSPEDPIAWGNKLWRLHRHPSFVLRSLLSVRTWQDLELGMRGLRSLLGHERDYSPTRSRSERGGLGHARPPHRVGLAQAPTSPSSRPPSRSGPVAGRAPSHA